MSNAALSGVKIMFVHHEFTYGGASKSLAFWLNTLDEAGADLSIVTYKSSKKSLYDLPSNLNIITPINRPDLPILKRIVDLKTVVYAAVKIKPVIIISLMPVNSFYAYIASKFISANVIVSERGCPSEKLGVIDKIRQWTMNHADGAVFQTVGARNYYSKKTQMTSIVLPNPAETSADEVDFKLRKDEIVYVGRFEMKNKRHDVMLNVLQSILEHDSGIILNCFGDGPDLELVKEITEKMGLSDNVHYWGRVDEVQQLLENYKYFIFTSDYEGIPNALIEAMLAGMVCVSTDCKPGGARLIIEDQKNGLLLERGDVQGLSSALLRVMSDQEFSLGLSYEARKIREKFDSANIKAQLIEYTANYI